MKWSYLNWVGQIRKPLLIAGLMTYLGFHAMNGERGIYALIKETQDQKRLQQELQTVTEARQHIEEKVRRLRDDGIDRDLLDEQARRMLGLKGEDEVVVLLED